MVVADCARIIQKENLSVEDSVAKAMKELQAPIIGEVLVLLSVFIPTAFVSGITGALYKQFAVVFGMTVQALLWEHCLSQIFGLCLSPSGRNTLINYFIGTIIQLSNQKDNLIAYKKRRKLVAHALHPVCI